MSLRTSSSRTSPRLRRTFAVDAIFSGAAGLAMLLGATPLAALLGLPAALLVYAGAALLPYAALIGFLASRESLPRPVVWVAIAGNLGWAAASLALLLTGWIAPTGLGYAFVIAQAVVVAGFGEAQYLALRRRGVAAA